jgi:hypothetical protein
MPMRGELPPITARPYPRIATRSSAAERAVWRTFAALSNRDLHAVVAFCAIGILLSLNIILRFPDFGAQVAALAVFP